MIELVRKDIISVFNDCIDNFDRKDLNVNSFMDISNHIVHNASIFQDSDSVSVAVIIYSIYKILERAGPEDVGMVVQTMKPLIVKARSCLQPLDVDGFKQSVKSVFDAIAKLDSRFKLYIDDVIEKARIKKGGKLYEHGVSIARAAQILGITQWELMSYVGKTEMYPYETNKSDIRSRLIYAKRIFKII